MSKDLVDLKAQLAKELETLSSRVAPPSGVSISTKGKLFSTPDGQSSAGPLNVIILDWRSTNSLYVGAFNPKQIAPPVCFAKGENPAELVPNPKGKNVQHTDCATCPKNQWGSAPTGKGKACKNERLLAVVPPNATADTRPWLLRVSPTGVRMFDNFVNTLRSHGMHPLQVSTVVSFNPDVDYPTLVFGDPKPHDNLEAAFKLREAAQDLLDRDPDFSDS